MDMVPDWIKDALGCKVLVLYSVWVQNIHMLDFRMWTSSEDSSTGPEHSTVQGQHGSQRPPYQDHGV